MNFLENFEEILIYHFGKYPLMTPQDAVKLAFQSAKGCGHLVKSTDFAMSMLENELEHTPENLSTELFEPIGNGYIRLYLAPAKAKGISTEKICAAFIKSANEGPVNDISENIAVLKSVAEQGKAPFSEKELSAFLSEYSGEMLSHSDIYRESYHPAYRVILESLAKDLQ